MEKQEFEAFLFALNSEVWHTAFNVPEHLVPKLSSENHRRVVFNLNRGPEYHAALMPNGSGGFMIVTNKQMRKKAGLTEGRPFKVTIWKDNSEYGMPMPEEMRQALDLDPEGSRYFHALTPGKQRSLLYIIGKVKSSDIRIKKALVVLDHLNSSGGALDFKALNEAFKAANSRI